jgi:hypothetical protein
VDRPSGAAPDGAAENGKGGQKESGEAVFAASSLYTVDACISTTDKSIKLYSLRLEEINVIKQRFVKWWMLPLLLVLSVAGSLAGPNDVFESKKQAYLLNDGGNTLFYHERVWAWLENMKNGTYNASHTVHDIDGVMRPVGEVISKIIHCWGTVWTPSGYPPYGYGWCFGEWYSNTALIWLYLGYNNVISPSDRLFIQNVYNGAIQSQDFSCGSENSQLFDRVGKYLYAQYYPDVQSKYSYNPPLNQNIYAFSWEGRTYTPGNQYSAFQLTRDWIYYMMDKWVQKGNAELDSPHYTWTFINGFWALYEFALDPVMKRKARIMLDFLFLESVMDYSANHWGGALGRAYSVTIYGGRTRFYWDFFWNGAVPTGYEPGYSVLMSDYRIPYVIWDAGDLSDEPDNYYHINMEYNASLVYATGTGKWTYVTKFFNLGGILGSWELNIKSQDQPGAYNHPGVPFTMWINTKNAGEGTSNPAPGEEYITMGEFGYQYKNAVFCWASKLHYAISPNSWDIEQIENNWRFLKEGRTLVAVQIDAVQNVAGLEVAIEGVDYASFDDFKSAALRNCSLTPYAFVTTRGDRIGAEQLPPPLGHYAPTVKRSGESSSQFVWNFPFQRIQTIDHRGQVIVHWEGNKMYVKRHGRKLVIDFNEWTETESVSGDDTIPPDIVKGVKTEHP